MKKRIICMILSLVAVFSFFGFEATQTWFSAGDKKVQTLAAGDLKFTVEGELNQPIEGGVQKVLPGDTVTPEGGIKIKNESNIDSNLRVKVYFTYKDAEGTEHIVPFKNNSNDYISVEFASENWALSGDYYCYYADVVKGDMRIPAQTGAELENNEIPFISSIKFSGEKITQDFQGTEASVTVELQSKQADYVTWTELGTIS